VTYIGFVHISPLLHQQLHHFDAKTASGLEERGLAITLQVHETGKHRNTKGK
jgi:hypothetical protein